MTDTSWQNRVTLLVNSCDAYADLWQPFFTLLKRYFVPLPAEILLNTETKDFAFDGLNLRCVHSTAPTYGERMTDALREAGRASSPARPCAAPECRYTAPYCGCG